MIAFLVKALATFASLFKVSSPAGTLVLNDILKSAFFFIVVAFIAYEVHDFVAHTSGIVFALLAGSLWSVFDLVYRALNGKTTP